MYGYTFLSLKGFSLACLRTGSLLICFLVVMAGCAPMQSIPSSTQTRKSPPPRKKVAANIILPKEYDKQQVKTVLSESAKHFKTMGFKGLYLGMSNEQLNRLVDETPWGYVFLGSPTSKDYNLNWANQPQSRPSNFLKGDNSKMGLTWSQLGCETIEARTQCFPVEYVNVKFTDQKLFLMNLAGPGYTSENIDTSVKNWIRFAIKYLTKLYGPPDKKNQSIDHITKNSFQSQYEIPIYEWHRIRGRAVVYIVQVADLFGSGIRLEAVKPTKKLDMTDRKPE